MTTKSPREARPLIAGVEGCADRWIDVVNPYSGQVACRMAVTTGRGVENAVTAAVDAAREMATMPTYQRAMILRAAAEVIDEDPLQFASTITLQTGKAIKDALREVRRSALTLRSAATAAERLEGRVYNSTLSAAGEGLLCVGIREPIGVVGAITPFNAPFNLVMHKVAPALAAGNAIVVKPAEQAPLSALDVARLLESAGAPPGAVNVVTGDGSTGAKLLADPRVDMITFTGGRATGEAVRSAAGMRKVTLELGGNSPNVVHADADLAHAVEACVTGGFGNTGQSCNSVQRILVHGSVATEFIRLLRERAETLVVGDPMDPGTDVGTVVDQSSALRIQDWLGEARAAGAEVIGGDRDGAHLTPAIVLDPPSDARVVCEEVFGPVLTVQRYDDLEDAIAMANSTEYGLQSAVFTESLEVALRFSRGVRSGAVLVNKSSNFRLDHLPYGGVKASGLGREGAEWAVEEMTELKLVVLNPSAKA